MTRTTDNVWLSRFALLTALATLVLICFGGLVTSHGAGMAVPDWPNTFGYNLFFFPVSQWVGGIFYEHTHRLVASGVGLLTIVLAVWLWLKESRRWLRWLGVIAFFSVVLQGVLGGLRVVLFKDELGIFHAALGQLFFVLTCSIALFTSRWWLRNSTPGEGDIHGKAIDLQRQGDPARLSTNRPTPDPSQEGNRHRSASCPFPSWEGLGVGSWFHCMRTSERRRTTNPAPLGFTWAVQRRLRRLFLFTTILIFAQLVLGATMRHQHAGLAIPDFPAAYGHVWPALDAESVARYNQNRVEVNAANPITAFQIVLQMGHRFLALVILLLVLASAWLAQRRLGRSHLLASISGAWFGLILVQVLLGAATVWTGKSADIATAHVAVGALLLMTGTMLVILASGCLVPVAKVGQRVPPAPNREGRRDARPTLSFKSSVLSLLRMHWDHEPGRAQRRAGVPPAQRARQRERFRSVGVADGGRRDACPTLRFMERTSPIKWP